MINLNTILDQADASLDHSLERLFELMRIPSISTDPAYDADCKRAADWLVGELTALGFRAEARTTPGQPMVIAHGGAPKADGTPHVLFYGHYDVQPVDPLELWHRDPFDPAIVDAPTGEEIQGRGSSDDKGQLMTFIEACRAYMAAGEALPVTITFILEGEEESGSPSLIPFLQANRAELSEPDYALVCDTNMWNPTTPAITTRLRGLVAQEVVLTGPSRDLHSGLYGGAARNPITLLTQILGSIHDADGHITIPHFYDGVPPLPPEIKAQWDGLDFSTEDFLGGIGLETPAGERGLSVLEQLWARPTAEINGIFGGYTGEGTKTVIPSKATAKLTFRLVGDQDPDAIARNFQAFVQARVPDDCSVEFHGHAGAPGHVLPIDSPELGASREALKDEFGNDAVLIGSGGSIPIVGSFKDHLGLESLMIGFALEDDRIHSPNEKYALSSFHKGIRSWVRIIDKLGNEG